MADDPLTGNRYLYAGANPAGYFDDGHALCDGEQCGGGKHTEQGASSRFDSFRQLIRQSTGLDLFAPAPSSSLPTVEQAGGFLDKIVEIVVVGYFTGPGELGAAGSLGAGAEARGGAYLLRDEESSMVMRTGRSNDLARREFELARDTGTAGLSFEPVYRTEVYASNEAWSRCCSTNIRVPD